MKNPWLSIPLADYEAHMALPDVGQAAALASELADLVRWSRPASLALLGCAGGNGLDHVDPAVTRRVVALDINPDFLEAASRRFAGRFDEFQTTRCDIAAAGSAPFEPVDAIFAGLVLEYVPLVPALRFVRSGLETDGVFVCVIQQESASSPRVSTSPYSDSLSVLSEHIRTLKPEQVIDAAVICGLRFIRSRSLAMPNGKVLVSQTFVAV